MIWKSVEMLGAIEIFSDRSLYNESLGGAAHSTYIHYVCRYFYVQHRRDAYAYLSVEKLYRCRFVPIQKLFTEFGAIDMADG